jgi:signal transduction histidine kinase
MAMPVDPAVRMARIPRAIPRVDVLIAGGLLVWALLEAFLSEGPGSAGVRVLLAIGFTVPLAFRRRLPLQALAVVVLVALLRGLLSEETEVGATPMPSLLLGTFSAALYARPEPLAYAAIPLPFLAFALGGHAGGEEAVDYGAVTFITLGAWIGGWLVRRRAEQVERAIAESGELAREAVADERGRIARELHDVVAHSVSIVAVQTGAAEELIERDPARAREHLDAARRTSREALIEMRRLLDVLREDGASYAPQPGLDRVGELIDDARAAGLEVEFAESGDRGALTPGVELTIYRVMQEALTNVRKHAGPVPTRVAITYGPEALELEVRNEAGRSNGSAPPGGHGLIGMRERLRLFGGALSAGAEADGGYRVHATLPRERAAG